MKLIYLLTLLITCSVFSKTYTPSEMANLAEERAPLILMQLENNAAAKRQISQSKLIGNPIFTLQTGSLKAGTQAGSVFDVTLNQPLPWPGKRSAEINSAKILENISDTDLEEAKLIVHHAVTLLGLELATLKELEKHNKEREQRFSIIHRFLTSRPLASPRQIVEKNLIETQIRLVETYMFDLNTKKKSVSDQLARLTGELEPEITLDWSGPLQLSSKEFYAASLEDGPDIKRSNQLEKLAINRIEQASYQARPDILVGVNYRKENVAPVNHFYHANLSIVIPIIDRAQHSVEVARAEARREEASKKVTYLNAMTSLNNSYQKLVSAHHSMNIFKLSDLKKIERQFRQAEDAFRKGRIDVTTFLQSDVQIHDSIDLAYTSYLKYYMALSEIKMLTGQKLEVK